MKLRNPFKKSYTRAELSMFQFLKKVNIFSKLSYDEISQFSGYMHERNYKEGEVIFFRGDPSHALYIIKSGSVSLNLDVKDQLEQLTVLGDHMTIGDNCLLQKTKRIYTAVVASDEAEVYVIPQLNIIDLFEQHPKIKAKMIEAMSERYNQFITNLFISYKASYGFFDLAQVYEEVT